MSSSPNKLSRFWQELKRRKVLRSLAIYAGTSFIILEASTIIFPLWNFPEWSINLVLWLLILGALINVIIAWIYDITPGGMRRTKPMEEVTPEERIPDSRGWKAATYISLVVIIGLIILNLTGGRSRLKAGDIQSLVILPIENFTGDDQLEYFVSGLHFSLIGDIQKIGGLKVKSRTSSNVYEDVDISVPQIASELDVDAVLEAGVMCLGEDSLCIRLSLITSEEEQIWIADYKVERGQILNLYSRVAETIADEVMVELTPEEKRLFAKDRTVDREAYDAYLKSRYLGDLSRDSLNKALEYLNLAIDKDPNFAPLYLALANTWSARAQMGTEPPEIARQKVSEYVKKALELDPDLPEAHAMSAGIALEAEWNWEKAEKEQLKSLAVNPNDPFSRVLYGHFLMMLQRTDEALAQAKLAVELAPLDPSILALSAPVFQTAGEGQIALDHLDKALSIHPHHFFAINLVEAIAFQNGDLDKAFEAGKFKMKNEYLSHDEESIEEIERIFEEQGFFAAYEAYVPKLEIVYQNRYINPIGIAMRYCWLNNYQKAMDWIEIGFEDQNPNTNYIISGVYPFDSLYTNPRFIAILEKMNLPIPKTD